jgi:hypothetical protein
MSDLESFLSDCMLGAGTVPMYSESCARRLEENSESRQLPMPEVL